MIWRITVENRSGNTDSHADEVLKAAQELGVKGLASVKIACIYNIEGACGRGEIETIARELLCNPVTQTFRFVQQPSFTPPENRPGRHVIEITHNPGVMDPVEASTLMGIRDLNIEGVRAIRTAQQYSLFGELTPGEIDLIVEKVLSNKLIQHTVDYQALPEHIHIGQKDTTFHKVNVPILNASRKQLMKISREGQLFLNEAEMTAVQAHYQKLRRDPTDCELETIAQTWSEHCFHKTFRGDIAFTHEVKGQAKQTTIRNLLKSTIVRATRELDKSWCVSVFDDNAGVIKFDKDHHVCFKVETHNHPSALEPYGGANTGIGGVIRDILGTGLGAKPVCNTDVFCFASPETSFEDLPPGTLHPKRVMKGVVSGVRDYGNKMGIPTVNGAVIFDEHYVGNPLVYCGCVGIIPKGKVKKKVRPGDKIVVAGGRTGRDGIHGATFSSGELTTDSEVVSSGAVQIGDPIQEKKVADALLKARDAGLYSAVTDCGAGGLSSAVGEMGEKTGARVNLDSVPLKYDGLSYMEIWISESQERMVFSVPPAKVDAFLEICQTENVEATVIGDFTDTLKLELFYHGEQVADLDLPFLFGGNPRIVKTALWKQPRLKAPRYAKKADFGQDLKNVLSHGNVCSKEWIIRQYDHEVQGGSVVKPLVGPGQDGPSDASVITPKPGSERGLAISNGINPNFGKLDPFWMAVSCIDEAIRQIVSVGGDPRRIAILDNFCWGNPDKPDRLGGLVRAAQGCYEAAVAYGVPFISGKDSLYNEYTEGRKSIAIPGTLLISAIGLVEDVARCVTMDLKKTGSRIYVVGETRDEMGGSIYLSLSGQMGDQVPRVNFEIGNAVFAAMHKAVGKGLLLSSHDCSDGGLAVALAEMAFAGGIGVDIDLDRIPVPVGSHLRPEVRLFSESNTRFVVEVAEENSKSFEKLFAKLPVACVGESREDPELRIRGGAAGREFINESLDVLRQVWKAPLDW